MEVSFCAMPRRQGVAWGLVCLFVDRPEVWSAWPRAEAKTRAVARPPGDKLESIVGGAAATPVRSEERPGCRGSLCARIFRMPRGEPQRPGYRPLRFDSRAVLPAEFHSPKADGPPGTQAS